MIKIIFMTIRACLIFLVALCGATLAPPLDAADFLFTWEASTDQSVAAYGVYQRSGDSLYERIAEVRVEDLDDPASPRYMVTGLNEGSTYRFAATSISASDTESDFFNQTCVTVNGQAAECTDTDESGTTVSVSCFIRAAHEGLSHRPPDR